MAVVVRRVEPGDVALLRATRLAALLDTPSAFGSTYADESSRPDEMWVERATAGATGFDRATFFAFEGDDIVGLVGGFRPSPSADEVDLVSMWVAPVARRRGVARTLVDAILEWARAGGMSAVSLWVTRGNEPAAQLYRTMGFVPTGEHAPLPSDPCKEEERMTFALS